MKVFFFSASTYGCPASSGATETWFSIGEPNAMADALAKTMNEALTQRELDPTSFSVRCFDDSDMKELGNFYETLSCSEVVRWVIGDDEFSYYGGEESMRWVKRILAGKADIAGYAFESMQDLYNAANDGDTPICGLWEAEGDVFSRLVGECEYNYVEAIEKLDGAFYEWRKANHPPRTRRLDDGGYVVAWDREDGTPRPLTDAEKAVEIARLLGN